MLILPPGRDFRYEQQAMTFDGAEYICTLTTVARRPLIILSFFIGNGSSATSGQCRTVWSLTTGAPTGGTNGLAAVVDESGYGASPSITILHTMATGGVSVSGTESANNRCLRDWPSVHGIDWSTEREGQVLFLPAGATPNQWSLRLIAAPASTIFNADLELRWREVAA